MKKLLALSIALLALPTFAFAAPVSWDGNVGTMILQPLQSLWSALVKADHFQATSTTASIFPYASTTALSASEALYLTNATAGQLAYYGTGGRLLGVATSTATNFAYPFTAATNFNQTAQATTTQIWFRGSPVSLSASSTAQFVSASSTNLGSSGSSYFATSGGSVGVGTTTPGAKLSVITADYGGGAASGSADDLIVMSSGNTGLSILSPSANTGNIFFGDPASAIVGRITYDHSNDSMAFLASGEVMRLVGGNVGIGSTTPNQALVVNGNVRISAITSANKGIFADNSLTANAFSLTRQDTVAAGDLSITAAGGIGLTGGNNSYSAPTASGFSLYVTSAGSVGVGTTTPWGLLSVNPTAGSLAPQFVVGSSTNTSLVVDAGSRVLIDTTVSRAIGATTGGLQLEGTGSGITGAKGNVSITRNANDTTGAALTFGKSRTAAIGSVAVVQTGDSLGRIDWAGADGTDITSVAASVRAYAGTPVSTGIVPGRLAFLTANTSGTNTEAVRINEEQLVGINDSTPTARLSITGVVTGAASAAGLTLDVVNSTLTDNVTAAGGTAANFAATRFSGPTYNSTNLDVSYTEAYNQQINMGTAGSNVRVIVGNYGSFCQASAMASTTLGACYNAETPTGGTLGGWPMQLVASAQTQPYTQLRLKSARAAIVAGGFLGGIEMVSDDTNLSSPGTTTASIAALAAATHTAATQLTDLVFRTTATGGTATNTEKVRITGAGDVGIGTTSPQRALDISRSDTNTATNGATDAALAITNTNTTNNTHSDLNFSTADSAGAWVSGAKILGQFMNHTAGAITTDLVFVTRNAGTVLEKMRLAAAGNLGIGTTSPVTKLQISADNTGATENNTLRFEDLDTSTQANQAMGKIEFFSADASAPGATVKAYILAAAEGIAPSSYLSFATDAVTGTPIERMRINSSGNVGIGTTTINNQLTLSTTYGTNSAISIVRNAASDRAGISFSPNDTVTAANPRWTNGLVPSEAYYAIQSFDGSTNTNRLVINASGNVGIGTTTPQWMLNIASSTAPQLTLTDGIANNHWSFRNAGGLFYLATSSPTTFATSTVAAMAIDANGNVTFSGTVTADNITASTTKTYTATYDPASLAANTSRCDDVAVTGITVGGGAVDVNPGVDPNGSCVIAAVRHPTVDQVRVCWRNTIDAVTACDTTTSTWQFTQSQ